MSTQTTTQQADGFSERDAHHDAWVPTRKGIETGKRLMHLEMSGPAFRPTRVAVDLAKSLTAQGLTAAGEVLQAIDRSQLLDVLPAWHRLLKVMGIHISPVTVDGTFTEEHPVAMWDTLNKVVLMALANCEQPCASIKWLNADVLMRSAARTRAKELAPVVARGTYQDGEPLHPDALVMLRSRMEQFRAYADEEIA